MISEARHLTKEELEAGLDELRRSPRDEGVLELIVRRPRTDEREVLAEATLDLTEGLVGDKWKIAGKPNMQINVMNARAVALVAQDKSRWPLAGDQLFIDLDLSTENLPPGTQLAIGSAIIEVTPEPHNGCKKFMARYGEAAVEFVNSPIGKQLHLRGINAKVVQPGMVRTGDTVRKLPKR